MGYTTSTVHGIEVPDSSETNNIPEDIGKVVTALEAGSLVKRLTGAAIAALTAPQKPSGLLVYNTTTNKLQISDGTNFADVDATAVSALGIANAALPKAGGTMTGKITLDGAPSSSLHAATKAYADLMLPKAGGTMSGAIAMGGNKVTGLAKGTATGDAIARQQIQSGNTGVISDGSYAIITFSPAFASAPHVALGLTGVENLAGADIWVSDKTSSSALINNSSGGIISADWIAVGD